MDHDVIVEQWLDRGKRLIEHMLQAPDLHHVASASLAVFAQMRQVAREILQAKIAFEAQQCRRQAVGRCCPATSVQYVHTRTVGPETLFGEITIPIRTFQCSGCGATFRPDDAPLGMTYKMKAHHFLVQRSVDTKKSATMRIDGLDACMSSSSGKPNQIREEHMWE